MIKLVIADIRKLKENTEPILRQIAPAYVGKYEKKKNENDKLSELTAGYLLFKYLGVDCDSKIRINDYEKPYLVDDDIFFNLSHSGEYVALCIADCEVGVDIEKVRAYSNSVAVRVFTQDKQEIFETLNGIDKDLFYSKSWTEVEAIVKCRGVGFAEGWKGISTAESNLYSLLYEDYYVTVCLSDKSVAIEDELEVIYE